MGLQGKQAFYLEDLFENEQYCRIYRKFFGEPTTRSEVTSLEMWLTLTEGDRVLDVPCGFGRHSNKLARNGYDVSGLDLSEVFLDWATEEAAKLQYSTEYRLGDMRSLPWQDATFDAAYTLQNSFGYFDDPGNRAVLKEISRVLKPGGRYVLQTIDRDAFVYNHTDSHITERNGVYMAENIDFDPSEGRVQSERFYLEDDTIVGPFDLSVRIYTITELIAMVEQAGFDVVDVHGNMSGSNYEIDSNVVLVLEKIQPSDLQ